MMTCQPVPATAYYCRPASLCLLLLQGGIEFHDGGTAVADLHYEGPGNQRRGRADTLSKIMFQYYARRQPLLLEQLLACVHNPEVDM